MANRPKQCFTSVAELLNVPYSHQKIYGYCLPACVQMALAYLGIERSQDELARILGMFVDFGVPASHLLRLRSRHIQIKYEREGNLSELRHWMNQQISVIACVHTGLLSYWQNQITQHAVLVVGIDEQKIYLLDPAKTEKVIAVLIDEFLLAWDEMEFAFAVITT
jgi:ABC-type bacteriocin/lantibiotic exporter with double-glycine peptidase domain